MKPSIAFHTLGCKVNQYDTQAMAERFAEAGYREVPFDQQADVYLINTCTVTGTGDRKSLQLARRLKREHPESRLILCGCLAQKAGESLLSCGADLIVGTQFRNDVVSLLEEVMSSGVPRCAVQPLPPVMPYESLHITRQHGHTRAVLKIQEGCNNRCTYCIIPSVRGPIRSRPLPEIGEEARRLRDAGFREIVLTGIHLSSWGLDFSPRGSLLEVIELLQGMNGIDRIRLGSLEPVIATQAFAEALGCCSKVCPQFHLALQSGSDAVLRRMKRRYNTDQFLAAVEHLRAVYPRAAFTTDLLTGFPGETEEEFGETARMIDRVGFARIHVFPYSPREDTLAQAMPGQLSAAEKESRARRLIALGKQASRRYLESWIGETAELLPEETVDGCWEGYTPEYIRVRVPEGVPLKQGIPVRVRLSSIEGQKMTAEVESSGS